MTSIAKMETRRICRVIAIIDIYVSLLSLVSVFVVIIFMGIATYSGNHRSILDSEFELLKKGNDDDTFTKVLKPLLTVKKNHTGNGTKANRTETGEESQNDSVLVLAAWILTTLTFFGTLYSLYAAFKLFTGVKADVSPATRLTACRLWCNVNTALLSILILDSTFGTVTGLIFSYIGLRALAIGLVNSYIKELTGEFDDLEEENKPGLKEKICEAFKKLKEKFENTNFDQLNEGILALSLPQLENIEISNELGKLTEKVSVEDTFDNIKATVEEKVFDQMTEKVDEAKEIIF